MGRRIVRFSRDKLGNLPSLCRTCLYWEGVPEEDLSQTSEQAAQAKREHIKGVLSEWGNCGQILYDNGNPVGFAYYGAAENFPRSRFYAAGPVSRDAAFLCCIYVAGDARGQGRGKALLVAMQRDLYRRKIRAVETFGKLSESDAPCGPAGFYLTNGFRILREDPEFPLLRMDIKQMVAWQESVEQALKSLKAPLAPHPPKKAPVPL